MNKRLARSIAGLTLTGALITSGAALAATTPVASQKDAVKAGVPATGKGSLKGMAQDPAATAASNNPALSTLVAAVKAAGLVDTLNGPGPFTIFAPANSAFAKLPAGTVETLVKPENKATLSSILTYHVIAGKKLSSKDLAKTSSYKTVNGESLSVKVTGKKITVNGTTKVVLADVQVEVVFVDVDDLDLGLADVSRERVARLDRLVEVDAALPMAVVQLGHADEREEAWRVDLVDDAVLHDGDIVVELFVDVGDAADHLRQAAENLAVARRIFALRFRVAVADRRQQRGAVVVLVVVLLLHAGGDPRLDAAGAQRQE